MPLKIVAGILIVAAIATLADWAWFTFGVPNCTSAGVAYGAVLLTAVGGALGAASGRLVRGLPIGMLAGIGGALSYYVLFTVLDELGAILAAWVVIWISMAVLEGRWISGTRRSWLAIAGRGTAAAALSGIGFYLVYETLWGPPPAGDRNYAVQFGAWAVALAPGMVALTLTVGRRPETATSLAD